MTLTSTDHANTTLTAAGTCPAGLVRAIRAEVRRGLDWQRTADRVVRALRRNLPDPASLLSVEQRRGDPAGYQSHLLYAEPGGSFSVSAMVWLPGQQTPVHDHVAWCVTAVLQGREHEDIFAPAAGEPPAGGPALRLVARNVNLPGSVSAFAPPGDIHRVRNTGEVVAI